MRTKTLWFALALLVASFALVAAGCGGDDEESTDGGTTEEAAQAAEQVITVNWGTEPPSLDPGLASDVTSANILLNIMDPLVVLDEDLNPVPNAAESIERSEDGLTVTFTLRDDLAWTNGDPVTAEDFEWSWKRTVSPRPSSARTTRTSSTASRARRSTTAATRRRTTAQRWPTAWP
jgi:oligopeptide transport system substrate-binding protein